MTSLGFYTAYLFPCRELLRAIDEIPVFVCAPILIGVWGAARARSLGMPRRMSAAAYRRILHWV